MLPTERRFLWMSPVTMTLLRMPRRPPEAAQLKTHAHVLVYISRCRHSMYVTLPSIALVKLHDITQIRPLNWTIISQETNTIYNDYNCFLTIMNFCNRENDPHTICIAMYIKVFCYFQAVVVTSIFLFISDCLNEWEDLVSRDTHNHNSNLGVYILVMTFKIY